MSKADQPLTTSRPSPSVTNVTRRRAALGLFAAGILTTGSARVPANPDAELIRLCDAFNALEADVKAAYYGPECIVDDYERDDFLDPIRDDQEELLRQIVPIRATTLQGIVARAVMYATWDDEFPRAWEETGAWDDRMLLALVRDAAALADSGEPHDGAAPGLGRA